MSQRTQPDNPVGIGQHLLPKTGSARWAPAGILHKRFTVSRFGTYINFPYTSSIQLNPETDIDKFIESILPTSESAFMTYLRSHFMPQNRTPMDFGVYKPCYIVFELGRDVEWQFRPGFPAVTTKDANNSDYGDLVHVYDDNTRETDGSKLKAGCRIAFLSVRRIRPESEYRPDGFNLNVEFLRPDGKTTIPILIDPDIQNPGGHGRGGDG